MFELCLMDSKCQINVNQSYQLSAIILLYSLSTLILSTISFSCLTPTYNSNSEFFNITTIDITTIEPNNTLQWGAVLYIAGWLAISLAFTCQIPVATPNCTTHTHTQNCLQTLPNISWGQNSLQWRTTVRILFCLRICFYECLFDASTYVQSLIYHILPPDKFYILFYLLC